MNNDSNYGFRSDNLEHKIMYPFYYRLSKGPSYFEYETMVSESKGPPEASKGPTNNIREAYKLRRRFEYDIIMLQTLQQ